MSSAIERMILSAWGPPLALTLLLLPCLVHGTPLGDQRLAFRDAGFFYTPLYEHVARFDDLGSGPAWNALDATGMPLAGETTTAVFYPVRWIVYQTIGNPTCSLAIYAWAHLILASLSARWLAARSLTARSFFLGGSSARSRSAVPGRVRKSSVARDRAASIAGWIYPMSGGVVFLVTNPPFLVSAAWLPMALIGLTDPRRIAMRTVIASTATALAMMVLAGDPQTALHAVIILGLAVIIQTFDWSSRTIRWKSGFCALTSLVATGIIAGCLAAPQIAASLDWSSQSDRVAGIDASQRYLYSLAPWRFAEWLAPFASGRFFPINQRITATIPGDGAMWTPSIFASCLAVPALIAATRRRRRQWIAITALASFAAMGHFGLVWWIQTTTGAWGRFPSELGGLYDGLCRCVPGYHSFRYPAKWLPLASLGVAMTAAQLLRDRNGARWRFALTITAIVLVVGMAWNETVIRSALEIPQPDNSQFSDVFWGPLDVSGAGSSIRRSYLVSVSLLGFLAALVGAWASRRISFRAMRVAIVTVVAVQMVGFAIAMIPTTQAVDARIPRGVGGSNRPATPAALGAWMRYSDSGKWPETWRTEINADRLSEIEASLRASRFGRWHLADNLPVLNSMYTINSQACRQFWDESQAAASTMSPQQASEFWKEKRKELGAAGAMDEQGFVVGSRCDAKFYSEKNEWLQYNPGDMSVVTQDVNGHEAIYHIVAQRDTELRRPVYQDGHWKATITGNPTQTLTITPDGLFQTIRIPQGQWTIQLKYSPWWWWPTIAIAGITAIAMVIVNVGMIRLPRASSIVDGNASHLRLGN